MKLSVAAAAIAFSGTAMIFAPTAASAASQDMNPQATAKTAAGKAGFGKADFGTAGAWTAKGASETGKIEGMGGPLEEVSLKGESDAGGAKFQSAGIDGKFDTADMDVGAKFETAGMDMDMDMDAADMTGKPGMGRPGMSEADGDMASVKQTVDRDSSMAVEAAAVSKENNATGPAMGAGKETHAGMGGPEEATTEYPPCSPGRGDDRCIQLYERGVGGGSAKGATAK